MDSKGIDRNQCMVQLKVQYLLQSIPNQFCNLPPFPYHLQNLPWVWIVVDQQGCQNHHQKDIQSQNFQIQNLYLMGLNLTVVLTWVMGAERGIWGEMVIWGELGDLGAVGEGDLGVVEMGI